MLDAGLHWAGGSTHLVQLGDIVDRGDDSRKVLDLVRRLEKEAQAARGRLHLLLGNHEATRMLGDLRLTAAGEYAAFATRDSESVRDKYREVAEPGHRGRARAIDSSRCRSGSSRCGRPSAATENTGAGSGSFRSPSKIDGFMFVHGGISPAVAPLGCAAINEQVRRELTTDLEKTREAPLASLTARVDGPLWYRGLAQESDAFAPQIDEILSKAQARAIVVAHTVATTGRITSRFDGRVIQIDTGMQPAYAQGGRASALEIARGEITAIYVDRRDPVTLPKRQGASGAAAPQLLAPPPP